MQSAKFWRRLRAGAVAVIGSVAVWAASSAAAQTYRPQGSAKAQESLVFGIHPYANPKDLYDAYEPMARYLESKVKGLKVTIEASRDYADFEAKLAAGKFHLALPNPYETLIALDHGYSVIAKMTPDEDFRGLIVVRKDRGFKGVNQLAGKTVAFASPTAVAGAMLPLWMLHGQGLDAGRTFQTKFVGSQFASLLNVYTGDVDACGSTVRFWRVWSRDNPDKASEMEVIARTESLPHNAVVARHDVDHALAARLGKVFAGMDKDPALDVSKFKQDQHHFEPATAETYKTMRVFIEHYDREVGLPASMKRAGR